MCSQKRAALPVHNMVAVHGRVIHRTVHLAESQCGVAVQMLDQHWEDFGSS